MNIKKKIAEFLAKIEIRSKVSFIMSIISLVVTIYVAWYTAERNENWEKQIQRPYLVSNLEDGRDDVAITIENKGEGTAVIEDVVIKENGEEKESEDLVDCILMRIDQSNEGERFKIKGDSKAVNVTIKKEYITEYSKSIIKDAIEAHNSMILFGFYPKETDNTNQIRAMKHALKDYEIDIYYRAVYDDVDDTELLTVNFEDFQDRFEE